MNYQTQALRIPAKEHSLLANRLATAAYDQGYKDARNALANILAMADAEIAEQRDKLASMEAALREQQRANVAKMEDNPVRHYGIHSK